MPFLLKRDMLFWPMLALIEYWKKHEVVMKNEVTPVMMDYVSCFLLENCGGHAYPVRPSFYGAFIHPHHSRAGQGVSVQREGL